ncbi:MAG TPA: MBL fold metallo-hydrolase [Soehngenia sp.]|nr:MBL fold metallo-hydrolase [Soehngenia sp.]
MSFSFCSLSSGSSGNCQYIETKNAKILVDAGFTGKRLVELLANIDVDPKDIDAILVTHEHIDHAKGVGILSRKYNIPIYANEKTWMGMEPIIKAVKSENIKIINANKNFEIKDVLIHPFNVSHDALDPLGYLLFNEMKKITILTDTGCVNEGIKSKIRGSHLFFIEANHDIEMLRNGSYPIYLKKRILSQIGHLSNDACLEILREVLVGENEQVLLAHLSKENNLPQLAFKTIHDGLRASGYDVEKEVNIHLTNRDNNTKIFHV